MFRKNLKPILLAVLVLLLVTLACDSSTDEDQAVRTLAQSSEAEEDVEEDVIETDSPTDVPPTDKPKPTATQEIEGLIPEGTSLVGTDIEPGVYVGLAGDDFLGSCYWERLSGLSGEFDDLIANDNAEGLFYIEVLESDVALTTDCELLPIDKVSPPDTMYSEIGPGTYLIGRDIEAGTWRGDAGESCYWERLTCVSGDFNCIITNSNPEGQFFVEISDSDYAFSTDCQMQLIEE